MVIIESLKVVQSAKNQERLSITLSLNDMSFRSFFCVSFSLCTWDHTTVVCNAVY